MDAFMFDTAQQAAESDGSYCVRSGFWTLQIFSDF